MGLEALVKDELRALGYTEFEVKDGRLRLQAPVRAICLLNLWLRTAERVKLVLGRFSAEDFGVLFEGTRALPWEQWLGADASFPVVGNSIRSQLKSVADCQRLVKKAIVERLKSVYGLEHFPETGPQYKIEVSLFDNIATLSLDTSGAGLHKRGYRLHGGGAPLRETLAAALVLLSNWDAERELVDPCCGSGTILIEAAMIARQIAPGLRRKFAAEAWPQIPASLWQEAREDGQSRIQDRALKISGADIDETVLRRARENATRAGLEGQIHWQRRSLSEFSSRKKYGVLISNPPYGKRLGDEREADNLARELGELFSKLDTWSFYLLSADPAYERLFGARATKKRKLYNAKLRVDCYQFIRPVQGLNHKNN